MEVMTIEEIRRTTLDILLFIDDFCRSKNITYYLAAGTLLGAIRHNGFIPWDDDIDIMMPRSSYDRFVAQFPQNEKFKVLTPGTVSNYPYSFTKVIDNRTIKVETSVRNKCNKIGVDGDVFPIDNIPNDLNQSRLFFHEIDQLGFRLFFMISKYGIGRTPLRKILLGIIISFYRVIDFLSISSIDKLVSKACDCSVKYNSESTDYCGVTSISHYGIRERNPKSVYASSVLVKFEGLLLPAPVGYKTYLTNLYGDYMSLPPVNQRLTHHSYEAYWREE